MHVDPRHLLGYPFDPIRQQVFAPKHHVPQSQAGTGITLTYNALGPIITGSAGVTPWVTVEKTATTSRNTTTTLADDPDLVVPMTGGKKYVIRGVIKYVMANATMDIKIALAYPGTMANHYRFIRSHIPGATAGTDMTTESQDNSLLGSTALLTTSTTGFGQLTLDIIAMPTTSETWAFQWAQNTSDGGNLSVLVGSYLEYVEIP